MRATTWLAAVMVGVCMLGAVELAAQEQAQQPETRIITVTTFNVPPERNRGFVEFFNRYVAPELAEDPNVISYRLARHYWGASDPNAWLITEYTSLESLHRSEQWVEQFRNQRYPEGSTEREEMMRLQAENFMPVFMPHTDHILMVNMRHSK